MGECATTSKLFLTLLCLIFWAAGVGLLYVGAEVFITYNNIGQLASATYTLIPATIILAVGVFMFLLGVVGCVGGCKESKCLLALFFTVLLVIMVGEVAAGFLGFAYRGLVQDQVNTGMRHALNNYTNDQTLFDEVNYVQQQLHCCGVTNFTDWYDTPWGRTHPGLVPSSCCRTGQSCSVNPHNSTEGVEPATGIIYNQGCLSVLKDKLNTYLGVIAGVAFGFALLEILGMICSCILLCRTQRDLPYSELQEDSRGGLRV